LPVTALCKVVDVSTSAYYRWLQEPTSKRQANDQRLDKAIVTIFNQHKARYGATRIYRTLKDEGWQVTEERVSRRMKVMGLASKAARKYTVTTDSDHNKYVSDNLLQQNFSARQANEKWVTDISYIPTDEGWLYLCVIIDLYSRAVIGWAMDKRMKTDLVCNALKMALFRRSMPKGVIIHSDKGSQYCSNDFQKLLKQHSLISSMSGKGCCYDNAACESFFGTLKVELVHDESYKTRVQAKSSIFEYIEAYYNTKRKHSTINYMTPKQFEDTMKSVNQKCPKLTG
jgi:transposase InsO family protein